MNHLNEDDLVLHFYGELDADASREADTHLGACATCRAASVRLQRVLAAVDTLPDPALPPGFERTTWARLQPQLSRAGGWGSWFAFSSMRLGFAAAVIVLVAGAFFAGRLSKPAAPATMLTAEQLRERVLLVDLSEHLDRSQMMLVDLVSTDDLSAVDITSERRRAEDLVAANRLYRQTATSTGDARIIELLDELERVLVDLAAAPDSLSPQEMEIVRQRIETNNLLFKVRVLSNSVRERQKQFRTNKET